MLLFYITKEYLISSSLFMIYITEQYKYKWCKHGNDLLISVDFLCIINTIKIVYNINILLKYSILKAKEVLAVLTYFII